MSVGGGGVVEEEEEDINEAEDAVAEIGKFSGTACSGSEEDCVGARLLSGE